MPKLTARCVKSNVIRGERDRCNPFIEGPFIACPAAQRAGIRQEIASWPVAVPVQSIAASVVDVIPMTLAHQRDIFCGFQACSVFKMQVESNRVDGGRCRLPALHAVPAQLFILRHPYLLAPPVVDGHFE
jgi:hypothetical protein